MKKFRFLSVVLATILIICSCPGVTFASSSSALDAAKDNLTLELVTHQSHYAITKALDLSSPALNSFKKDYDADILWSTPDTDVLAISGNTVSVNRGEKDREVSLIATIKSGTSSAEKELTFTVPSKNTFVYESEGFGYPELEGQLINNIGSRWGRSGNDEYYYATVTNADGEYVMEAYHPKQNDKAQTPTTCFSLSDMPETDRITVEFTIECKEPESSSRDLYYDVLFCPNENASPWYDYTDYLHFEKNRDRTILYSRPAGSGTSSALSVSSPYPLGQKARIRMDFSFEENTYDCYWNGNAVYLDAPLQKDDISEIHFNIQRFGKEGRFYLDDLLITAPVEDIEVPSLAPSSIGALEVDYTNGFFNVTAEYDKDNYIVYKSGNTTNDNAHFDHHGVWLKNKESGTTTLLLERISADETAPPKINGAYLGANHGPLSPLITVANHGLTYKDIGTYWQAGNNGGKWTLVKIVDANRLMFIGDNWASGANAFVNEGIIRNNGGAQQTSGTLTNLDGSGQVLNFTAQAGNQQLFPSFINKKQTVYAVSGGEKREITDLSTIKSLRCDRLILDESYIITDPTQMASRLRNNRPEGGYTTAPVIACGDPVLSYHQTITFMEDGTVITEFDHEFLKAVNALEYYGYQYYMKNNYGGGVKRYVPDTKPFTAAAASYTGRDSFTAGASKTFDFSIPHQVISGTYFDYPQNARPEKSYWADPGKAPNRIVDYMINSDGSTRMAFANGYLPLYDGANEIRSQLTSQTLFYYGSVKAYPIFINSGALPSGTKLHGVAYKKHDDTAKSSEKVQSYSVMYGDDVYYYIDFLESSSDTTIKLPESFDAGSSLCIDMTGAPEYEISGDYVTVSGSQKDYIVLKSKAVSKSSAVINKTFYNVVNGNIQADIANPGSDTLEATAVAVCYDKNGRMIKAQTLPAKIDGKGTQIVTFDEDFSQGSYCKVFLFGKDSANPLCINGYSEIN